MPLFGSRKPIQSDDQRRAEEQLKSFLGGGPVEDQRVMGRIVKQMLLDKYSIDVETPSCANDVKIGGLIRLARSSKTFQKALIQLDQFPTCLQEIFNLTDSQLRYLCLKAGFAYASGFALNIAKGKPESAYIGMSDNYLQALRTTSYNKALDMIIHISNNDPKSEVDRFLKKKEVAGFSAITDLIDKAISKNQLRKGKFDSFYYAVHEGYWYLDEEVLKNPKEMTKAFFWLAGCELGIPKPLVEDLLIQIEVEWEKMPIKFPKW
jgi:hypothetical protein